MYQNTLTHALPIVAAAYGRKFGVAVQVGGDLAATDGTVIHLPALRNTATSNTLAWGYLSHEAAHLRYTDFPCWQSVALGRPLTKAITNILEDIRIENALIATYPGTRQTLDAVLEWMIDHDEIVAPAVDHPPPRVFVNALLVQARHRYRQQSALTALAQTSEHVLRQVFPPRFVHRLVGLMTEIGRLDNTADTARLAQRMVDLIKEETEQPPPSAPPPNPTADSDADSHQANNQQEQAGAAPTDETQDRAEEQPGDDQGTDTTASQTAPPCDQRGTDSPSTADGCQDTASDITGTANLQEVLAAGDGDLPPDVFETIKKVLAADSHGASVTLLPSVQDHAGNHLQGRALLAQAKGHSAQLINRLQGLVQAHTLTQPQLVRRGRRLSSAHLHRVAVGDSRIFVRKDAQRAPNTALHVLVDLSGSMVGSKAEIALEAAMALALALEPMAGVSRAVTAFPALGGNATKVTRILSHGDRVRGRAGAFVQDGRGDTPMTGALWFAAADLIPRREARKVILTLTDGRPDDTASTTAMIAQATRAGIEMIGIGIQRDVSRLFPVAIRIASVADLKGELFRIAEQLLLT